MKRTFTLSASYQSTTIAMVPPNQKLSIRSVFAVGKNLGLTSNTKQVFLRLASVTSGFTSVFVNDNQTGLQINEINYLPAAGQEIVAECFTLIGNQEVYMEVDYELLNV